MRLSSAGTTEPMRRSTNKDFDSYRNKSDRTRSHHVKQRDTARRAARRVKST